MNDGWPDHTNDSENKDWSVGQPSTATAYTDLVQEFEPGKPWKVTYLCQNQEMEFKCQKQQQHSHTKNQNHFNNQSFIYYILLVSKSYFSKYFQQICPFNYLLHTVRLNCLLHICSVFFSPKTTLSWYSKIMYVHILMYICMYVYVFLLLPTTTYCQKKRKKDRRHEIDSIFQFLENLYVYVI